jgi:hypothetical protein
MAVDQVLTISVGLAHRDADRIGGFVPRAF